MTPKEQAKELVDKFTIVGLQQRNEGIQCALIAVDEILNMLVGIYDYDREVLYPYWQQVKEEIKKL
jgi:hypothetical protein